jgi:hypothetical protein
MRFGSFNIFARRRIDPHQRLEVAPYTLVPAHMVGVPENMERWGHRFSNRELGELADIARRHHARASLQGWHETLMATYTDGATLTAAASASMLPTYAKISLQNGFCILGKKLKIVAQGRISNVVTTPGTARFDLRFGSIVVFDTGAINLNVVAKTNVPWWLEVDVVCRAVGNGTSANLFGFGTWQSEALVGSPANTAGGNGSLNVPVGVPAVGAGFDSTSAQTIDMNFTQTVATGSMTCHSCEIIARN